MALRKTLFAAFAAVASVCAAASAQAGTFTIASSAAQTGQGGEFKVTAFTDSASLAPIYSGVNWIGPNGSGGAADTGLFRTFCVEKSETISYTSYSYTLGSSVVNQNGAGPDPLSDATAKLYYTFWTGQWSKSSANGMSYGLTYDYFGTNTSRQSDAAALQAALWYLEGEIGSVSGKALDMVNYATNSFLTWANLGQAGWSADGSGNHIGGVTAINPYSGSTNKQSQLVVLTTVVPLPAGALMGFALLGALGVAKRVRSRRSASIV